jgi:hypothetical protein
MQSPVLTNSAFNSSESSVSINYRGFLKQILYLSFYDGIVRKYNYDSIRAILSTDKELIRKYDSIKERKLREKAIIYFVKQYNNRNLPIVQIENTQFGNNAVFQQDALKED